MKDESLEEKKLRKKKAKEERKEKILTKTPKHVKKRACKASHK
jgi:hypothetical protein